MRKCNENDLLGGRFGKLRVNEIAGRKNRRIYYLCKCDCGNNTIVRRDALLNGNTHSCGHCFRIVPEGEHFRYFCSNGDSFIFDKCDIDIANSHQWHISRGYPVGREDGMPRLFSRVILKPQRNQYIDHIDGNTRNNLRSNLRIVTHKQNMHNMHIRSNNSSGYKGVSLNKRTGKYEVHICLDGKDRYLGLYDNKMLAANVYDCASRKLHGEYGCVNFPKQNEHSCHKNFNELEE